MVENSRGQRPAIMEDDSTCATVANPATFTPAMRPSLLFIPAALAASLPFIPTHADLDPGAAAAANLIHQRAVADMTLAAKNFLASLDDSQKAEAVFKISDDERLNWHFVPLDRKGITLDKLRPEQDHLAYAMLNSVLSNEGFAKTATIMSQERILFDLENQAPKRNTEKYYLAFFGDPSDSGAWGWRWEGHHFSCNVTIAGGKVLSVTPSFMGTNPGEVKEGPRKGLRVLAEEEDTARLLVKSLTDTQKPAAFLEGKVPDDVISKEERKAIPLQPAGISADKLDQTQRNLLWKTLGEYIGRFRPDLASVFRDRIHSGGMPSLTFAWSGGTELGEPHYYRIQSPEFLFEYDNTQNNANHPHAVWRDFTNDFGVDLLKKHYDEAHTR